jgi:hypothetical protein
MIGRTTLDHPAASRSATGIAETQSCDGPRWLVAAVYGLHVAVPRNQLQGTRFSASAASLGRCYPVRKLPLLLLPVNVV